MMKDTLKLELIEKITLSNDENLLQLLKADYDFFNHEEGKDNTDELSPQDYSELVSMVNEPFGHETESYEDFLKAIDKWLTK